MTHVGTSGTPIEDLQYGYDADNEITSILSLTNSHLLPQAANVASADAAGRIAQFGQKTFTFDAEGETTSKTDSSGTTSYQWDARGRLTAVVTPGNGTLSYSYDALGRRIGRTSSGTSTTFLYDGSEVVEDLTSGGSSQYINGPQIDERLRQNSGSGPLYFLGDQVGSTAFLTDVTGSVAEAERYEPYGGGNVSALTRYSFTGREAEPASGLIYYRARYYDPEIGRFIGEDPDKDGVADSLYAYVGDSPILWSDPFGMQQSASALLEAVQKLFQPHIAGEATPEQVAQINAGFAEALSRLNNPDCMKLFCKNKENLDPVQTLRSTYYVLDPKKKGYEKGAYTVNPTRVYIYSRGVFFTQDATANFPSDQVHVESKMRVDFESTAVKQAALLLHELGHQVGIFPPDLFDWINGSHSLRVLEACFKKGAKIVR